MPAGAGQAVAGESAGEVDSATALGVHPPSVILEFIGWISGGLRIGDEEEQGL